MAEDKKTKEQVEAIRQANLDKAVLWVMSDPRGRLVIWWLLSEANIFRKCFTGNSQTFYLEGMRELGLKIYQRVMTVVGKHLRQSGEDLFRLAQNENYKFEEED